jgi:hypothetical protein
VALAGGGFQTRVRVSWPAVNRASVTSGGKIEVQWRTVDSDAWDTKEVPGDSTETHLTGMADGQVIVIRARSRNSVAVSDWSAQITHVVIGKTEPPDAPSAVALTSDFVVFTPSSDIDVAGYRILYNVGNNPVRSVATALHTGLVSGSPWPLPIRLYGINTIIVVAVDTSGNESAAAYDVQDLGLPDAANVADEVDYVAALFPGTISNATVSGGVLVADVDPAADFYGAGSGSDIYYRDGAADIYGGSQYLALQYTASYASPYSGGVILMDLETTGARTTVETRTFGSSIGEIYDTSRADIYADDIEGIYGAAQDWRPWNGSIVPSVAYVGVEFRVTVDAGSVQGSITTMTFRTEMPTLDQTFGNVAVSAAGTFLAPTAGLPSRSFISIEDVQVTPIGSAAISGRAKTWPIDPELGPEIELIGSAGTPVSGNAFVQVKGF